jgi:flagellar hook protein FlgE
MGFAQGVSGLNSSAANLDVIGNNIANSGTVGFKSGNAQFADVYAGSRVGLGTQVSGVLQNFTSGAVQTSSRALDVAIVNGDGFFRLASPGGEVSFSRNGQFNMDKNGYLVNSGGMQLTGYQVGANGAVAGGSPGALQLPTAAMAPQPTTTIAAQFNIDSRGNVPTATPFNANDSTTYNYSNSVTVFDSLGNSHELSTFFVKAGANTWDAYASADGQTLTATGARPDAAAVPPTVTGAVGALTFDGNGVLTSGGTMAFAGLAWGTGAVDSSFTLNVAGTTQFGNVNDVKKLSQDGYTSGLLTSFAINQDGTITGKYSNEQTKALGQIVLSSFVNPNGLQPKGNNVWTETAVSGQPLTGTPGSGTKVGALASGAVETSNVDLTTELVNLIIAQRTYQANSQTVKTQDQVMQTLINLR